MDPVKKPLLSTGGAFRNTTESPLGVSSAECDSGSSDCGQAHDRVWGREKNGAGLSQIRVEVQNKLNENETESIYKSLLFSRHRKL